MLASPFVLLLCSVMFMLLVACVLFPLPSFALPSFHPHAVLPRAPHHPRVMTYYPDWAPPQFINYSLFDIIIFAFALPDHNFQLGWDSEEAPTLLANLVPDAHAASSLVMLSIGGWTGSRYFSNAVATPQNRDIFTSNILDVYKRYNLDGIDIDWEYPGQSVQQGNSESAADSANMLQFFKDLHQKLPPGAMISAAVQDSTFVGPDGQPMKDVSTFSEVLDFVTLMNYDAYQIRQPPGPNAPLSDGCHNSSLPNENAVSAYDAWTLAGFSPSQIVLGVPAYGYIVDSNAARLSERSPFRAYSEDGTGQIQFRSLVTQGLLVEHPDGSFKGTGGFIRQWDNCSATPFLYSHEAGQVIPYDDNESLAIKAAWVKQVGMGGVNLFDAHGDTSKHHLTNALRAALFPNTTRSTAFPSAVPSSSAMALSLNPMGSSAGTVPSPRADSWSSSASHPSSMLLSLLPNDI